MIYSSLEKYEGAMKKQFLGLERRGIGSNPAALTILRLMVTIFSQFLQEAQKSGRPQVLRSAPDGEMGIICYPSGKMQFFEQSIGGDCQTAGREYTELTLEERAGLDEAQPIGMDDVLDIHRLLRDYDGDLMGMVS